MSRAVHILEQLVLLQITQLVNLPNMLMVLRMLMVPHIFKDNLFGLLRVIYL